MSASVLGPLVRREARDERWHVVGALLATTALVPAFYAAVTWHRRGLTYDEAGESVGVWVALATALGGGSVAADAFAGDTTSRRIDGAALLPTPLANVFAAKAIVVVAAALLLGAWAAAWAPIAAAFCAPTETALGAAHALAKAPTPALLGLVAVAATSLFAVVLEHALGAVLAALVSVGGTYLVLGRFAPWDDWGVAAASALGGATCAVAALTLLAAAGVAFARGPIHLGFRVRRAALGLGIAGAALAAGGSASVAALETRAELAPGDDDLVVSALDVSPDGRTAAVMVGSERVPAQCHAWLVDVASGGVTRLPGRYRVFEGWTSDGGVRLRLGEGDARRRTYERIDTFDVATGALRRVRSQEQDAAEPWREEWARFARTTDGHVAEWPDRGIRRQLPGVRIVKASPTPGRLLLWRDDGPARVLDLDTGSEREVPHSALAGDVAWLDGERLRYRQGDDGETVSVLDVSTGTATRLVPPSGKWGSFGGAHWAEFHPSDAAGLAFVDLRDGSTFRVPDSRGLDAAFVRGNGRYAVAWRRGESGPRLLVDCATRSAAPLEGVAGITANHVRGLPDGTLLCVRPGPALDVIDGAGRTLRNVATLGPR